MTGFEAQCKFCPDKIWMEKDNEGKWKPMDINNHTLKHVHRKEQEQENLPQQPKAERPVIGDPNHKSDPVLLEQAEKRVREIVREEIIKFLAEAATRYEKASRK